jgi:hypothetical protein
MWRDYLARGLTLGLGLHGLSRDPRQTAEPDILARLAVGAGPGHDYSDFVSIGLLKRGPSAVIKGGILNVFPIN